ncbi:hypothetical protein K493DRAFT_411025 [Basidiobolus meristosporus CBS 931.73]|uniref:Uncharacterized protein n=1 Tax=Basidiobolus meristosporus CBS 931.73 TaxID=1314790 RepID=A0A1Y1XRN3_9FUNG|nr:hypothetical protein K493DRAFT_411025 [Basidiobolus meristosporus CBS 931.73]|eukprot:ORX88422.1 hypothetical protein K493DRAFT_411025 [Basidiobolus meristosporus CBS 931.73]
MLANLRLSNIPTKLPKVLTSQPPPFNLKECASLAKEETEPEILKEYIKQLLIYSQEQTDNISKLNNELKEANKELDSWKSKAIRTQDEIIVLKEHMQITTAKLVTLEEQFVEWQSKLVDQHQQEVDLLQQDFEHTKSVLENKIDVLKVQNKAQKEETERLTSRISDLVETTTYVTKLADFTEQKSAIYDSRFEDMQRALEVEKKKFSDELVIVTKRRMEIQNELIILEEEYDRLRTSYSEQCLLVNDLRDENRELRELIRDSEELFKTMEDISLE